MALSTLGGGARLMMTKRGSADTELLSGLGRLYRLFNGDFFVHFLTMSRRSHLCCCNTIQSQTADSALLFADQITSQSAFTELQQGNQHHEKRQARPDIQYIHYLLTAAHIGKNHL
jgi:hypothetical protein